MTLTELPAHIYILGGSPCSGKSTLAERLVESFGLQYYKADDYEDQHPQRATPEHHPVMTRYNGMGWNEIWSVPPEQAVEDMFAYYRERFAMVLEDLATFRTDQPLLAEGFPFLPQLIHPLGVQPQRAFFLVPSFNFQMQHYPRRPWIEGILQQCADPQQAFHNWMQRDYLAGREILKQARALGYPVLEVDGSLSLDAIYTRLCAHFGFV